ncbi:RNA polymerase sigma factor [Candidatus Hydrogenedentota bacterium]
MNAPDTMLWQRWHADRDADAFTELVSRHSGMVYATCRRVLGNASEAEDIAQECFVKLMMAADVSVRESLGPWLHTTAFNTSLNQIRGEKRRREREVRYAEERIEGTDIGQDELLPYVNEAIAELPEKLRMPIIGRFLEGRTHEGISRDLGVAESTVRYRLDQGVDRIRKHLKRRGISITATALAGVMCSSLVEAAPATLARPWAN